MKNKIKNIKFSFSEKCQGDQHIFLWMADSALDDRPPADDARCQCGKVSWKEYRDEIELNYLLDFIQRSNGIYVYPEKDDDQKMIYTACLRLEARSQIVQEPAGEGCIFFRINPHNSENEL